MAPELLLGEEYNKQVDWWAVGIIIYEMIYGKNPFNLQNKALNFKQFQAKVYNNKLDFEYDNIECSSDCQVLISKLLS